ncbi:hypothetical protein JCM11641_003722 [Rhodosporidiobolus odoratus]
MSLPPLSSPLPPVPSPLPGRNPPPVYRPASAKPPQSRIPTFPLVDAYVPDTTSTDRRHPRQLVPKDVGFPTPQMRHKMRKDDLEDRLLMATCSILRDFENRALCPKEVAEVMLERDWLKNAGTTPFAHVSTCIRAHIARASGATPPYTPLLSPFELVGALSVEEVRAVGLHAEQRPAVKRGTLWYLNPKVFGPGVGPEDPFVRCRREAGLAPSEKDGLYVRGLAPLQASPQNIPPDLKMSAAVFHSNGVEDGDGEEEGMGRGKRKRRASSAMMAAIASTPTAPSPLSASVGASGTSTNPVAIPPFARAANAGVGRRRAESFAGPASAPVRSSLPRLKLRLAALEEHDSGVDDSDGFTGEAADRRKKNKKKARRAGSEGLSRAGSVESSLLDEEEELPGLASSFSSNRASGFSSVSSSALLAQSLLAASSPAAFPRSESSSALAPHHSVSPDILSLANSGSSFPFHRPASKAVNLSMSAPNIFSHHFASAPSPPDVMDLESSPELPSSSFAAQAPSIHAALSPPSDHTTDEDDFHEVMLRGDDLLDFEWGSESYTSTAGTSSIEPSTAPALSSIRTEDSDALSSRKGKERALTPVSPASFDDVSLEAALRQKADEQASTIDTPATTPRSPGKEFDLPAMTEKEGEEGKEEEDETIEVVPGPLGTISRVGMRVTLCGAIEGEEEEVDDDVVIVDGEDEPNARDADVSLTSLVHDTPPSSRHSPRGDAALLAAPPPSPLPLEFSMGALTNAFAATDFDFVGYDDVDGSPFFRGSLMSYCRSDGDSADDEEEEDDLVTVKVEDEDTLGLSFAPSSSRDLSACPSDPAFDSRGLAGVRASSISSSSSDSDFDPMQFVSAPLLATGLAIPHVAPSPPESNEWSFSLDMLEDIDGEAVGTDMMAPESIGLDQLDLAWAGGEDESLSPPPPSPTRARLALPRSGSAAFLTGSRFTSAISSPRRSSATRVPLLGDFPLPLLPPTLARTSSATTIFAAGAVTPLRTTPVKSSSLPRSAVDIESSVPLDPPVKATIVTGGIVVFSVDVVDLATFTSVPLLRRLDTGYCNVSTLLQSVHAKPADRSSALASLLSSSPDEAFHVSSTTLGLAGTWVSLPTALQLAEAHSAALKHLSVFLEDELAVRFPEPIPTMRAGVDTQNLGPLGKPAFEGAETLARQVATVPSVEVEEPEDEEAYEVEELSPPPPRRTGRTRKPSVKAESDNPAVSPKGRTRSSTAAAAGGGK